MRNAYTIPELLIILAIIAIWLLIGSAGLGSSTQSIAACWIFWIVGAALPMFAALMLWRERGSRRIGRTHSVAPEANAADSPSRDN